MNKKFLLQAEIWADIKGYEGLYQASNLGRIRSLDRMVKHNYAEKQLMKGQVLKPFIDKSGYWYITLSKECSKKRFLIHRLVYSAFNGEIPEGMQVNHINEDKTDNRLSNLNIMTPKENANWGTRNERHAKAQSKPVVAYDDEGNIVLTFSSLHDAGRNGYKVSNVWKCCTGKAMIHRGLRWKYKDDGDC